MRYTEINSTTAELKFYGYIGSWWISAKDFTDTLEEIEKKYKTLHIRAHCYGGEVFEGNVMFNALQRSKLETVFIIEGVSASMSSIVMLACNKIKIADNGFVMIHAPSSYTSGGSKDHFSTGKLLKSLEQNSSTAYARRTGKPVKEFEAMMDGTDYWLSANECLEMKLADEIIPALDNVEASKPDAGTPVEKIFGLYTQLATAGPTQQQNSSNNTTMTKEQKQALIDKHKLTGVTADSSDTAVQAAIDAKIEALERQNQQLQQSANTTIATQADAVIAAKEVELKTKFSPDQKARFNKVAATMGLADMKELLDEIKPVAVIADMIKGEQKENAAGAIGAAGVDASALIKAGVIAADRKDWNFETWEQKDAAGLYKLSMSKDPATEAYFNAMYAAQFGERQV